MKDKLPSREEWRSVVGYEGYYEVSNNGQVRSVERIVNSCYGSTAKKKSRFMNTPISWGYPKVNLSKNHKVRHIFVHRLVASAFIPNPNGYPRVNHKNLNKTDNRVENLEWCTDRQNSQHAVKNGHYPDNRGEKHGCSKLTNNQVGDIRKLLKTKKCSEICKIYAVTEQCIRDIKNHRRWNKIGKKEE